MKGAGIRLAFALLLLLPAAAARGADDCLTKRCQNAAEVLEMRGSIGERCDCAGAANPTGYMKCVKNVLNQAVGNGTLSAACRSAVKKCEGALGCGRGLRPFRTVQQVLSERCALPACHSDVRPQGGLVLSSEEVSYGLLVNRTATLAEARNAGKVLVVPGDPENSFLVQKLRGEAPGERMPQGGEPLSKGTIKLIEKWIKRGARTTAEECPPGDGGRKKRGGKKTCNDRPLGAGTYVWAPQPALETPESQGQPGIQLTTPQRAVTPGTEWETCFAFKNIDWLGEAAKLGYLPGQLPAIKQQTYRMHDGSHHLLLYAYFGANPQGWADGYFPCSAASCEAENPDDCPDDAGEFTIPIGGTQVAGTRYDVKYPAGVGVPVLAPNMVLIANLHYTNPFRPAQEIYGESWLNMYFHRPGEIKAILDGIFAINYWDLFVEPYESKTISRVWMPRALVSGQGADAAVFQLFGHMHKRGTYFQIDHLTGGHCSGNAAWACGRDDDCRCWLPSRRNNCAPGQTCVFPPGTTEEQKQAYDRKIYETNSWDHAPVTEFQKPYLLVNSDQGLRWTCTHVNGVEGDPTKPPKRCHKGCQSCGWDEATRTCIFRRGVAQGFHATVRTYQEGEAMPVVFGELADDDMCNMFGYFVEQQVAATLP